MQLEVENSIVSLSGSNPLHQQSMQHVQQLGIVVYLDVQQSDILKRLGEMKVRNLQNCTVWPDFLLPQILFHNTQNLF